MKRILFTYSLLLILGITTKTNAQCSLEYSGFKILNVKDAQTTINGERRITTFVVDIEFNLKYNENAKYVYLHTFLDQDYKNFFNCDNPAANTAPLSEDLGTVMDELGKSIFDLAIDNTAPRGAEGMPVNISLLTNYGPDPDVALTSILNSPSISISKTYTGSNETDRFTVKNMVVSVNNYDPNSFSIKTAVWANDGTDNLPHCTLCPQPVYLNDPLVSGFIDCVTSPTDPTRFQFSLNSVNPATQQVFYKAYLDVNGNKAIDQDVDLLVKSGGPISLTGLTPYNSPVLTYNEPYATDPAYKSTKLLLMVEGPTVTLDIPQVLDYDPTKPCGTLPVDFKSFTAIRNKQKKEQVLLKWETENEQNNSGFHVQRKTSGDWENIAFIYSKASHGTSTNVLTYEYTDINRTKGVTQYRLLQVDLDGKSTFSDVKAVLGGEQTVSVLVYPNPSTNGKINLVFSSQAAVKEVIVSDMNGRVVKYFPKVSNNNLTIEGLVSGIYTIKITDRSTSVSSVEKVVVK